MTGVMALKTALIERIHTVDVASESANHNPMRCAIRKFKFEILAHSKVPRLPCTVGPRLSRVVCLPEVK